MKSKEPFSPFEKDKDADKQITVGMLKKMLKDIPNDFEIKYDSAYGSIRKGDFLVIPRRKEISLNG